MKFDKGTTIGLASFLLAIAIAGISYVLFFRNKPRTLPEVVLETSASGKTPAQESVSEDEEDEEIPEAPPIPFVVKTDSIIQETNSIQFIVKSHYLPSAPDCEEYIFNWMEVKLPAASVAQRINKAIQKEVYGHTEIAAPDNAIPGEYCNGQGDFEFTGQLTLVGELLHAYYYQSVFIRGGAYPNSYIKTSCFSLKTGDQVNLNQLLQPDKIAELDSFMVNKHAQPEDGSTDDRMKEAFREQLGDLNFVFADTGLSIILRGYNHATSYMALDLDLKQTEYYLKPEIFAMVYKNQK